MTNNIYTSSSVRPRLIRLIMFMILALGVVFFSTTAKAQGVNPTYNKAKYRIAVHKSGDKTCHILSKKRNSFRKHHALLLASNKRSRKGSMALAETDGTKSGN